MPVKLVTLEDDPDDPWSMANTLRQAGYHCRGYQLVEALGKSRWVHESDLAVIDGDGLNLDARRLSGVAREFWPDRPVLFVGRRDLRVDWVARRNDDWLVKPVSPRRLVACVRAALGGLWRRDAWPDRLQFGRYRFEPDRHGVSIDGTHVALTQKEYLLALLMFRNLSRPVSRAYIAGRVWRHDERINARTMTAHISTIRSKLQLRGDADYMLTPIYNYGYRLDAANMRGAEFAPFPICS